MIGIYPGWVQPTSLDYNNQVIFPAWLKIIITVAGNTIIQVWHNNMWVEATIRVYTNGTWQDTVFKTWDGSAWL